MMGVSIVVIIIIVIIIKLSAALSEAADGFAGSEFGCACRPTRATCEAAAAVVGPAEVVAVVIPLLTWTGEKNFRFE